MSYSNNEKEKYKKHNMILNIFKAVKIKRIILLHSNFTNYKIWI